MYPETRHIHSARSRASLLHDHCVHYVQIYLGANPYVSFPAKKRGLFAIELSGEPVGIPGKVLARFKKLNERMLTSNIPTKQAENFNHQRPLEIQGNLWGYSLIEPEPPHINIGYTPDMFWMGLEAVYATMPNGTHSLQWYIKLSDDGGASQTPVIDMPIFPNPSTMERRVTPKRSAERKRKGENS